LTVPDRTNTSFSTTELTVMAVLHRVFDDPAEAGIVENAMVDDEAEGADLTLATCCFAW
jgi:hypothetical protein